LFIACHLFTLLNCSTFAQACFASVTENFESFDAKSIESGWGKKKNGQDFALVLNRG